MKPSPSARIASTSCLLLLTSVMGQAASVLLNDTSTSATRNGVAPAVTGVDRDGVGASNDYAVATNGSAGMATGVTNDRASNVAAGINGNSFAITNEANAYSVSTHFASTTLNPGDSLALSLNFRTTIANPGAGNGAFRIALFNSGGTQIANNTNAFSASGAFADDTGYVGFYSTTATGISGKLHERTAGAATNNVFQGTFADVGATPTNTNLVAFDTTYAATLTLKLSADGNSMSIASSFNGLTLGDTDLVAPFKTFDHVAVFFGSQFGNGTTVRQNFIDDLMVTYNPVPEPTASGLLGMALCGFLHRRRSARTGG